MAIVEHHLQAGRNGVRLVFGQDDAIIPWVASVLGEGMASRFEHPVSIGVADEKHNLLAGVVYYRYTGFSLEVAIAATTPRWATRGILAALFDYPFNQQKCERLTSIVSASNERAIKFNEGLGFAREGVARRGYDGINDAIVFGMLRDECRWIARMN